MNQYFLSYLEAAIDTAPDEETLEELKAILKRHHPVLSGPDDS